MIECSPPRIIALPRFPHPREAIRTRHADLLPHVPYQDRAASRIRHPKYGVPSTDGAIRPKDQLHPEPTTLCLLLQVVHGVPDPEIAIIPTDLQREQQKECNSAADRLPSARYLLCGCKQPGRIIEAPVPPLSSLEEIALASLEAGRLLMESGAGGSTVEEHVHTVARKLGAERVDLRMGYASLAVTVEAGSRTITRMRKVGPHGVNHRLEHAVKLLVMRMGETTHTAVSVRRELDRLVRETPHHPLWFTSVAVGMACAAFGRLLGVDWMGLGPVFAAAALGQYFRRRLALRQVNLFITTAMISFLGSAVAGLGARWLHSQTVDTAMIAAVLLLVPGLPAVNAQNDILEGRPTLGSARAVWVAFVLIFLTLGLWMSRALLGEVS